MRLMAFGCWTAAALAGACHATVVLEGPAHGAGGASASAGPSTSAAGGHDAGLCAANGPLADGNHDQQYFVTCVAGDPVNDVAPAGGLRVNCSQGNCHGASMLDFASPDSGYPSALGYVTKEPQQSKLVTYPKSQDHAGGDDWDDPKLAQLYQNLLIWLALEAKKLP